MKSILDPSFRYVGHATDVRKTFARVRREMRNEPADRRRIRRRRSAW